MEKDSESKGILTSEEAARMTLPEKVKRHAEDVMKTENNPEFLGMSFQIMGGSQDGECQAEYSAEKEEYIYSFLFGGGSLGHPLKPTIVGEGVIKVAELVNAKVNFLDFTFASFGKKINKAAIEKAFYPIFEMSAKLRALPQPVADSIIKQHVEQTRIALSHICRL